jgi:signal peptidase I
MDTKAGFMQRHPQLKDALSLVGFAVAVILGTIVLNTFVFRSYNVVGGSMENTLHSNDRIIVNRLPVTIAHLQNKEYQPGRGQIVVFVNPKHNSVDNEQFLIKRVLAFAGERVVIENGKITVYNTINPDGFDPDIESHGEPKTYSSGDRDLIVPEGEVFVAGDNREGSNSYDSRNGLGTVPLYDIIGPASVRIFPLNKVRLF